jgi:hypothetical protein
VSAIREGARSERRGVREVGNEREFERMREKEKREKENVRENERREVEKEREKRRRMRETQSEEPCVLGSQYHAQSFPLFAVLVRLR